MNATKTKNYCPTCGRSVLLIKHERTGNVARINDTPTANGNVLIDEEKGTWRVVSTVTERDQYIGRLHLHHAATCPHAASVRRR